MNLRKLLLPLTFLGLSPAAHADNKVQKNDSLPQHKITHTIDSTKTTHKKTVKFTDAQEDEENANIQRMLISGYNAKPHAYRFDNIIKLLKIADNAKTLYNALHLSLPHAKYLVAHITPELQQKLGIKAKEDILFTAINHRAAEISEKDAFEFVATHNNLNKLKNPVIILNKALNIALSDVSIIGQSPAHINCISNIMNFALSHQDDKKITALYSKIFVTTAHMIRDYNQNDSVQDKYAYSINELTSKIEKFNKHITPGSVLDSELQIKRPHEYVIQEYRSIAQRVNMALVYNNAYYRFLSKAHFVHPVVYTHKPTQKLYQDYVDAIEIKSLVRENMATSTQKQKLKKLIAAHPEIELFDPYFSAVYLNLVNRDQILDFTVQLHTSKSNKALTVPKKIFTVLAQCNANAIPQQKLINQHMIKAPNIALKVPKKLSVSQMMKSVLNPQNIEKTIAQSLNKQLQDLDWQAHSMQKLIAKTPSTPTTENTR